MLGKILQFPVRKLLGRPSIKYADTLESLILTAKENPSKLSLAEKSAMAIVREVEAVFRLEKPNLWDAFVGGRLNHVEMALVLAAGMYRIIKEWVILGLILFGIWVATLIGLILYLGVYR